MNKEQQELLDEAYEVYLNGGDIKWLKEIEINTPLGKMNMPVPYSKEEFINKCKTDTEFSQKWELKIEERDLTYSERYKLWFTNNFETGMEYHEEIEPDFDNNYYDATPTKVISLTYNNKTIETYYDGRIK